MIAALAGCRATTAASGGGRGGARGGRQVALTLFRDAALVTERWRVPLAAGRGSIDVPVDAQLAAGALSVIDTGGARLVGLALRAPGPTPGAHVATGGTSGRLLTMSGSRIAVEGGDRALHVTDSRGVVEYAGPAAAARASVTLEGTGTEAWIELSYPTPRIAWSAAYALIRDASGERATLEGAVAIDNKSGVLFPQAAVTVVDDTIASWRGRVAMDVS